MKTDSLGRAFPTETKPTDEELSFTKNDLVLLEALMVHPTLSTDHLYRLGKRADKTQHTKRLRALVTKRARANIDDQVRDFGVVMQRHNDTRLAFLGGWRPRNLHQWYTLTDAGKEALKAFYKYREYDHRDQQEHRMMRSIIGAEIQIGVQENRDYQYKPAHMYPVEKRYQYEERHFEDDGMFGVDYVVGERLFFLEVDRGTEQKGDASNQKGRAKYRKTHDQMIKQWYHFLKRPQSDRSPYAKHFNNGKPGFALFVFANETHMNKAMDMLQKHAPNGSPHMLFRYDERFIEKTFPAPMASTAHWTQPWKRVGHPDLFINNPDKQ